MTAEEDRVPDSELRLLAGRLSALLEEIHHLADEDAAEGNALTRRLDAHLRVDSLALSVVSDELPPYQLIDVQLALESWAVQPGRSAEVVGVAGQERRYHSLGELLRAGRHVELGPVDHRDLADSPTTTRRCVHFGVFLLSDGPRKYAVLLRGPDSQGPMQGAMIEILAGDDDAGRGLLLDLRVLAVQHSVLRGQILALGPGEGNHYGQLRFVARPCLTREQLILPDETLALIERHVVGIANHSAWLRAAGQHLKRGVLLYGPPGTGKTHTVRYLLSQRPETTAFVLSGQALQLITMACTLARTFTPSLVILEDVDLIGGDRSLSAIGSNPLLFEVLNQIDGLSADVDVTFLLTTNRVNILERALAERPGRVDAAIEITAPDAEGRAALLRLYGAGMGLDRLAPDELAETVDLTAGVTATFLRELVRRAALTAAERDPGPISVDGATLVEAARELTTSAGVLAEAMSGGELADGDGLTPAHHRGGGWYGYAPLTRMRFRHSGEDEPPPFVPEP